MRPLAIANMPHGLRQIASGSHRPGRREAGMDRVGTVRQLASILATHWSRYGCLKPPLVFTCPMHRTSKNHEWLGCSGYRTDDLCPSWVLSEQESWLLNRPRKKSASCDRPDTRAWQNECRGRGSTVLVWSTTGNSRKVCLGRPSVSSRHLSSSWIEISRLSSRSHKRVLWLCPPRVLHTYFTKAFRWDAAKSFLITMDLSFLIISGRNANGLLVIAVRTL